MNDNENKTNAPTIKLPVWYREETRFIRAGFYDADDEYIKPEQIVAALNEADALRAEVEVLRTQLSEWTSWRPNIGILPNETPTHGNCCTCQKCGHSHDECVCEHNEIERALAAIKPNAAAGEEGTE